MDNLILLEQIKSSYKTITGLQWTVSDYFKVIKTFLIMYQKTHNSYYSIPGKKMPYILKSLQTFKPYEVSEMIEEFFNMQLENGKHHTLIYFCDRRLKYKLYNICFGKKKRS